MEFCEFEGRLVMVSKMMATICSPASRFTFPASEEAHAKQYNRRINNEKEKFLYTCSLRIEKGNFTTHVQMALPSCLLCLKM
jgi:hypothetical protein